MSISDKVKGTIKKYNLIQKRDLVLVGVSGGPDSVALLYLLNSFRKELGFDLHIAHLDHMLRKDSYKDKEFVERLACKLHIPITTGKIDIRKLTQRGSLEEIARNARFEFFFKTARNIKAAKIALGHNFDDQAETVLMRILRGTGLYGLTGILPKRQIQGYQVIRPLIEVRRPEIELFLKRKGIVPRRDASNSQDVYFRNRIRNKLIPLLEREYNKNIKTILSNMAESVGYDYDYLNRVVARYTGKTGRKINLGKFLKLHPALRRLILRMYFARLKGDTRRLAFTHIKELEDLISNRPVNSIVDLPKGVSVVKKSKYLSFYLARR